MNKKMYFQFASGIFLIAGGLHLYRVLRSWNLQLAHYSIPMWLSGIIGIIALYMAYTGWKYSK